MRRVRAAAVMLGLVALSNGACGEVADAYLLVQLRALASEDPFVGVSTLRVVLTRGEKVLRTEDFSMADGHPITMPSVDRLEDITIEIVGLAADDVDPPVSRGEATPELPQRGKRCCVIVCFCLSETVAAQGCGCGLHQCARQCVL